MCMWCVWLLAARLGRPRITSIEGHTALLGSVKEPLKYVETPSNAVVGDAYVGVEPSPGHNAVLQQTSVPVASW